MNRNTGWQSLLLFFFLISPALGATKEPSVGEGSSFPLQQALQEAMERNPEIKAAQSKWEEEKAKIGIEAAWIEPEIGVEMMERDYTEYSISQTFPTPSKVNSRKQAQEHMARSQWGHTQAKINEVRKSVKQAYSDTFTLIKKKAILAENSARLKAFIRVTESRLAVGKATLAEVLKAHVEYAKTLNALATLDQERAKLQAELNALLGKGPNAPLGNPVAMPLPSLQLSYTPLEKMAFAHRPELQAARHHVNHMEAELTLAHAEALPDTMVQLGRRNFYSGMDPSNMLMVRMSLPFVPGTKLNARLKAAEVAKEEKIKMLHAEETMTRAQIKSSITKLISSRRFVDLYQTTLLPQTKNALKITLAAYTAGKSSYLELIDTERTWLEAHQDYYDQLNEYWKNLADLEQLIGKDLVFSSQKETNHEEH